MVYSHHVCGEGCNNGDAWVLLRRGESWRVVERIRRTASTEWEPQLFPLRYVGLDAKPDAYHHRRAYVQYINAVTGRPVPFLAAYAYRNGQRSQSAVMTADAKGRLDLGSLPFQGIVGLTVGCPDPTRTDSIYAAEVLFSAGSDTTVTSRIDFRTCLHADPPPRLSGAQAFISLDEAEFVFPFRSAAQSWDLPIIRSDPGATAFWWVVDWDNHTLKERDVPIELWLAASTKGAAASSVKSLAELIRGSRLDAMFKCWTCDQNLVVADPGIDRTNVFARVVDDRIVFRVRGRKAVEQIFPSPPKIVTFETMVRHKPIGKRELDPVIASQAVVVNCRSSDSTGASRRRCDAPTKASLATPRLDSTSPRRVKVVAITSDGGTLLRNQEISIRSEDLKLPPIVKSTGSTGVMSLLQQPRDSVSLAALCPGSRSRWVSGRLALYLAAGRDTSVQVIVDRRRCSQ